MKARFVAVALTLLIAGSTVAAQTDQPLAEAVQRSIRTYPRFTVFDDVHASVEAGIVVLRGKVTISQKKEDIGRRVVEVAGVREVRNDIDVLPVSSSDDALRRKVARAIYSNPAFWRYAALPQPPIHILVEHGEVTLIGTVPTDVDRALAESLATGHGEISVRNELRTGETTN